MLGRQFPFSKHSIYVWNAHAIIQIYYVCCWWTRECSQPLDFLRQTMVFSLPFVGAAIVYEDQDQQRNAPEIVQLPHPSIPEPMKLDPKVDYLVPSICQDIKEEIQLKTTKHFVRKFYENKLQSKPKLVFNDAEHEDSGQMIRLPINWKSLNIKSKLICLTYLYS